MYSFGRNIRLKQNRSVEMRVKIAQNTLKILLEGNKNFMKGTPKHLNKCLQTLQKFAHRQAPCAVVLSCSDSRVVPEIIFDVGIGELFVIRTAGTSLSENVIESLEYAIKHLDIPLVILVGHDDCGVVKYASENYPEIKKYKSLTKTVEPLIKENEHHNDLAKKVTIFLEKEILNLSPVVKEAKNKNEILIVKTHFNFETGEIEVL